MKTLLLLLISLVLPLAGGFAEPVPPLANTYRCTVLEVHDGDTVSVEIAFGFNQYARPIKLRLVGVYAPELGKPGGPEAQAALAKLLPVGSTLVMRPVMTAHAQPNHEVMSFSRYVARAWIGEADVCEEMTRWLGGQFGTGAKTTITTTK